MSIARVPRSVPSCYDVAVYDVPPKRAGGGHCISEHNDLLRAKGIATVFYAAEPAAPDVEDVVRAQGGQVVDEIEESRFSGTPLDNGAFGAPWRMEVWRGPVLRLPAGACVAVLTRAMVVENAEFVLA